MTGDQEEQVAGFITEAVEFSMEEQKEGGDVKAAMQRGEAVGGSDIEGGRSEQSEKKEDGGEEMAQGWNKQGKTTRDEARSNQVYVGAFSGRPGVLAWSLSCGDLYHEVERRGGFTYGPS